MNHLSSIPHSWKTTTLENIAAPGKNSLVGNTFGSKLKASEYTAEGVPLLRGENLSTDSRFNSVANVFVTEEKARELASQVCRPNDVVFTQQGSVGQVGLIPEEGAYSRWLVSQSQMRLRVNRAEADPLFVYYQFRHPAVAHHLKSVAIVTGVPHINLRILRAVPVVLPPLPEQRRIAAILGALDDKIELNRKMNRTLEEIAQTLFQAWFVDFEGETDLVESELGLIPRGWKTTVLASVAELRKTTVKPFEEPGEVWEHYSFPAFDENQRPNLELGSDIKSNKYQVPEGAILVSKLNPRTPRVWRVAPSDSRKAICSTEFLPFVPLEAKVRPYLFELLRSRPVEEGIQSRVTGTTGSRQRVKPREIEKLPILHPADEGIVEQFCDLVAPLHARVQLNAEEIVTLAALRDTLLPKLISGEIRVPEAESLAEDVL